MFFIYLNYQIVHLIIIINYFKFIFIILVICQNYVFLRFNFKGILLSSTSINFHFKFNLKFFKCLHSSIMSFIIHFINSIYLLRIDLYFIKLNSAHLYFILIIFDSLINLFY